MILSPARSRYIQGLAMAGKHVLPEIVLFVPLLRIGIVKLWVSTSG